MSNHYHLLIRTPHPNLNLAMQKLSSLYTRQHNRITKTDGPLFKGRYKAILIAEDAYLAQFVSVQVANFNWQLTILEELRKKTSKLGYWNASESWKPHSNHPHPQSNQSIMQCGGNLAGREGLEPPTFGFGIRSSTN